MSKVYVSDLRKGQLYTFKNWINVGAIIQYVGSYQQRYDTGNTWKKHRFLWVKKPAGKAVGESTVEFYGENIRGTLGHYNEKR